MSRAIDPLGFLDVADSPGAAAYLADPAVQKLVEFFRRKGLCTIKAEDRLEHWYSDWIDYQAKHEIYAGLLSPKAYSRRGNCFDVLRLVRFLEVFAYFSPAHAYSLQVSFLGLFPFLMSGNEDLKREAVRRLEDGGLFAFAVSEQAHGSDLLGNDFTARETGNGRFVADGSKYYIGNANAACMMSVLAKRERQAAPDRGRRAPLMFFALRPPEAKGFGNVTKIRTFGVRSAFVGAFDVHGHEFGPEDVISEGRDAWDAMFGTVTLGKFFLAFGSIGICEHASEEALAHTRGRILYGKPLAEMPHIRGLLARAHAGLLGMKLYAYRAVDYVQSATEADRRYLLFNAVQKAKVSTEGVRVLGLLSECVGAKGFEADTYFEMALRDAPLIPSLEGSTHINYELAAQFAPAYFRGEAHALPDPPSVTTALTAPGENPYLFTARTGKLASVTFGKWDKAYDPWDHVPNVRLFREQAAALAQFVLGTGRTWDAKEDAEAVIGLGKCLATIAYAQLVAENAAMMGVAAELLGAIFGQLVEELSVETMRLSATVSDDEGAVLKCVVAAPLTR